MQTDAKKYLEKLRGEEIERGRVTLYLNKALFEKFRKACEDVAPSKVVEQFMREFLESTDPKKKP